MREPAAVSWPVAEWLRETADAEARQAVPMISPMVMRCPVPMTARRATLRACTAAYCWPRQSSGHSVVGAESSPCEAVTESTRASGLVMRGCLICYVITEEKFELDCCLVVRRAKYILTAERSEPSTNKRAGYSSTDG